MNVSSSYFSNMGRMAFGELADYFGSKRERSRERLYRHVVDGFPHMTDVLLATRERKLEPFQQALLFD